MNVRAAQQLRLLLDLALDSGAEEIRLESDLPPSLLRDGRAQPIRLPPMQTISVYAIHEECLFLADREDLLSLQASDYTFALPTRGSWRCHTTFPGTKAT